MSSRNRKVCLAVLAGIAVTVTDFFLWTSWKSDQIVAELKSIADRLQPEPGWENLETQPRWELLCASYLMGHVPCTHTGGTLTGSIGRVTWSDTYSRWV
jgi:hypothetical protein